MDDEFRTLRNKTLRRVLLVAVFAATFAGSLIASLLLSNQLSFPHLTRTEWITWIAGAVVVKIAVFYFAGNLFGWWSFVTFSDFTSIFRASSMASVLLLAGSYFLLPVGTVNSSALVIDWLATTLLLCVFRSAFRYAQEHLWIGRVESKPALFIGGNATALSIATRIHVDRNIAYRIVGLLDPRPACWGTKVGGIPVLGGVHELHGVIRSTGVNDLLVMAGVLRGNEMRELVSTAEKWKLSIKVIPDLQDVLDGSVRMVTRDVDINDLLRRDPVALDTAEIGQLLSDQVVMVTGAGGSIGSEICRQILNFQPDHLVLVEQAENSLFNIERELKKHFPDALITACIGDVLDRMRMERIFEQHRPSVIFHAAAHKHVPMMENNISEAVKNNSLATRQLADLAHQYQVNCFVFISTDKAVHPTSIMGATKHLAERYVHAKSQVSKTRFISVRFGNVLGSAGSVVPIFKEQIQAGGPITITDPRMTRFFMTIPEASQLVLQAGAMGVGGEIFVLDMGEPVRIEELAKDLIRLSGLPSDAIEIRYTGIRPGEKLYEQLYFDDEEMLKTKHPKLRAARHRQQSYDEVVSDFKDLEDIIDAPDSKLRAIIETLIPEFNPQPLEESSADKAMVS